MAKKKQNIPAYGTAEINGVTYFRTRITDADGKRVPIYASTCEELYKKEQDADVYKRQTTRRTRL